MSQRVIWEQREILIWGKTRPEISKTYREIVCTGGVFREDRRLVRIYPVPLRYLEDEKMFRKYQWIRAYITKAPSDPRPESYKIRYGDIEVLDRIPTERGGNWDKRAAWIMNQENIVASVEELQAQQRATGRSLALMRPLKVIDVAADRLSPREREGFWSRYKSAVAQMDLPLDPETGREIKPLSPPDYRFRIEFRCDDSRCTKPHAFSVLDWELDALYFRQRQSRSDQQAARDVLAKLRETCGPDRDLHFFLGNISSHQQTFTIVGLWSPKRKEEKEVQEKPQLPLFEE
jgi:hypothetical protein